MNSAMTISGPPAIAAPLVASLPLSYRLVDAAGNVPADVRLIDGKGAWADEAMRLASEEEGWIVVIDPEMEMPARIAALADRVCSHGMRLALSEPYAGDPALADFAGQFPSSIRICNMHATTGGSIASTALALLRVARALGLTELAVRDACTVSGGALLTLHGAFGGGEVLVRALVSSTRVAPSLELKARGADAAAEFRLFGAKNARPAESFITSDAERRQLPTIYETAHRSLLRGLPKRVPILPADLLQFAADVTLVDALGLE